MNSAKKNHPLNPLPSNIELITEYDAIVLRRTWKSPIAYFLVFFSLIWNSFMVIWLSIAISKDQWMMAAFGSIHGSVGVGLIYYTIALFRNKTDIRIDTYNLSINHNPLPWFGQKKIAVESIQQIFCKKKVSQTKNGTSVTYQVEYIDTNNRSKKLLTGLADYEQAQFIESEIEKTLGIKNRRVSGEHTN